MADQTRCVIHNFQQAYSKNQTIDATNNSDIKIYIVALSMFILPFVVVTNSLLIWGLRKTTSNKPMTITKRLFIYLSCVDIAATFFGILNMLLMFYLEGAPCSITFVLTLFSRIVNRLAYEILLTISFLRFLSIKKPFLRVRNRTLNWIMLTLLLLTTGFGFITLYMAKVDNLSLIHI